MVQGALLPEGGMVQGAILPEGGMVQGSILPECGNNWLLYTSAHGAICVIPVAWRFFRVWLNEVNI